MSKGTLSTKSGPIIMSNPPHPDNTISTKSLKAGSLDELKDLYKKHGLAVKGANGGNANGIPAAKASFKEGHVEDLAQLTRSYLNNESDLSDDQKKLITSVNGNANVQVYSAEQDIVVTPDNPWVISGQGPVVVNAGKVTIKAGGQIKVLTDASVTIQELIKE